MSVFLKHGKFCIIEKNPNEILEKFVSRGYFVVSQNITSNTEYDEYVIYSNIFVNMKYDKCGYNATIMNKTMDMMKNIYDS